MRGLSFRSEKFLSADPERFLAVVADSAARTLGKRSASKRDAPSSFEVFVNSLRRHVRCTRLNVLFDLTIPSVFDKLLEP